MKRFEAGKRYAVNGGGTITVTRRTEHFITFEGDFAGKRKIIADNLFNLGENILIPAKYAGRKLFCFAGNEANEGGIMGKFVKAGHIFEMSATKHDKVLLVYKGKERGFLQGCIWVCDDEAEAMDMVDAVIDPERYPDDEFRARHINEIYANCKW